MPSYTLALLILKVSLTSAIQRVGRSSGQCSDGSQMLTLPVWHGAPKTGFDVVMMADYPSAGSTWLRELLNLVTAAEGLRSPACAIYKEEGFPVGHDLPGVYCNDSSWNSSMGSLLVKSHFPSLELMSEQPLDDFQFNATMKFDKLLQLVRHPVSILTSYHSRWNAHPPEVEADNLHCWASWWRRAKQTVDAESFHMLRYEDLCRNTAQNVFGVLQFLGGRYASISLESVQRALSDHNSETCFHADELDRMSAVTSPGDQVYVDRLYDFMLEWGYLV